MKKQLNILFTGIGKEETERLTQVVKETAAVCEKQADSRIFSRADLWNIQRQKRDFLHRRYSF